MHDFEYNIALVLPFLAFAGGVWLWGKVKELRSSPTPPPVEVQAASPQFNAVAPPTVEVTVPVGEQPRVRPATSPDGVRGAWIRVQPRTPDAAP